MSTLSCFFQVGSNYDVRTRKLLALGKNFGTGTCKILGTGVKNIGLLKGHDKNVFSSLNMLITVD